MSRRNWLLLGRENLALADLTCLGAVLCLTVIL